MSQVSSLPFCFIFLGSVTIAGLELRSACLSLLRTEIKAYATTPGLVGFCFQVLYYIFSFYFIYLFIFET